MGGVEDVVDLEGIVDCYIDAAIWGVKLPEAIMTFLVLLEAIVVGEKRVDWFFVAFCADKQVLLWGGSWLQCFAYWRATKFPKSAKNLGDWFSGDFRMH